ncbi:MULTISPECIES: threonine/serine exporter family protein [unclassified Oleiphilus]|uniref:threonine/serine exporter family protein n=2 Tax=Oleiphilus TaxID=141450 RepID=UPI0018D47925|nr:MULTISPECIES: threonine/serine exporter family protein [unclassified Oleiphilus]
MYDYHLVTKIVDIGETLHSAGCPPYKLEKYVEHYARNRGIAVTIMAYANFINFQFHDETNSVIMKRLKTPTLEFTLVAQTINRIVRDDESILIDSKPPGRFMEFLSCVLVPPAYLLLVGSSLEALAFSPLFGIVVWLCMQELTGRRAVAIEFFSTFFVAIIAEYLNSIGFHISVWTMGIAAVLLFVPGLSISNALECFAFNDLVSGMSFLGQAILSVIKLLFGIFIGISFGDALLNTSAVPYTNELPFYSSAIGAVLLATSIGILFNIRPKDIWRGVPAIALGTWGPTLFSFDHGWVAATWITATLITLYST